MQPQDGGDQGLDAPPVIQNLLTQTTRAQQRVQVFLDSTTPYAARRWGATAGLLILFMLRVIIGQGWYISEWTKCPYYSLSNSFTACSTSTGAPCSSY